MRYCGNEVAWFFTSERAGNAELFSVHNCALAIVNLAADRAGGVLSLRQRRMQQEHRAGKQQLSAQRVPMQALAFTNGGKAKEGSPLAYDKTGLGGPPPAGAISKFVWIVASVLPIIFVLFRIPIIEFMK